ncbi:E3 ubiquitin-protein ligase PHF7-like isoform X3 [Amblyomma americanum]
MPPALRSPHPSSYRPTPYSSMAPRSRRTRQRKTASPAQAPTCAFCDKPHNDSEIGSELLSTSGGLHVHYMCMLFSSGLHQRGQVERAPLRGFAEVDVRAELRRGGRLSCSFCKRKGATVGCCLKACKKVFHLPCGASNGCLLQFFGDFRVYCGMHRPRQNVVPMVASGGICPICSEEMAHPSVNVLVTPCCRQLFHRGCIQRQAMSAGSHFFRCGHCNNQEAFQREMQEHGIYVPEQDASWEQEPHAFEDLLFRYRHCDAPRCRCPSGRTHHQESGRWRIVVCNGCGSQGVHFGCGNKAGIHWLCPECRKVISRPQPAAQREAPKHLAAQPAAQCEAPKESAGAVEVIEIDSDDDDDNIPQQCTARKSAPGSSHRLLDFAVRGGSSSVDGGTLQLTLETCTGSVVVTVLGQEPSV